MTDAGNMQKNSAALARCEKIYKYVTLPNVSITAVILVYSFFMMLISLLGGGFGSFVAYFVSMVLCAGACVLAVMSGYTKRNRLAAAAPVAAFMAMAFEFVILDVPTLNSILSSTVAIFSLVPTVLANKKYLWLKTQEGFPHFSVLLQEQQDRSRELAEHDPYEEAARQRKLTESSSMNDVVLSSETLDKKTRSENNFMDEI